jgi:hypothetical protein
MMLIKAENRMATSLVADQRKTCQSSLLSPLMKLDHRIHLKVAKVETYSFAAIANWAQGALANCTARPERFLRGAKLGT